MNTSSTSEPVASTSGEYVDPPPSTNEVILEAELEMTAKELEKHKEKDKYLRERYSVQSLSHDVLRMETGLPTKEVFDIVVKYVVRFKDNIRYYSRWKVESINLEDQVLITLMIIFMQRGNHFEHCSDFCSCVTCHFVWWPDENHSIKG